MTDTSPLPSGEELAREKQAADSTSQSSGPDPTGATDEQMAAKEASVQLGDQDAVNLSQAYRYPDGANLPTAQNVRRYPELFDQSVIDSFNVEDQTAAEPTPITDDVSDTSDGSDGSAHVTF